MKCSLLVSVALLVNLSGCQPLPILNDVNNAQSSSVKLEQISEYGANFAREYKGAAQKTCTKYTRLYQEGDWRAGWILALQVTETKNKHCLNSQEAIQILRALEAQKEMNSELIWLTHVHLNWLTGLEQQAKEVSRLKRTNNRMQTKMIEVEKQNQDLVEKLDALKAIETSINQ